MDRADPEEGGLARRLFCPALSEVEALVLGETAAQHARVLRLTAGDELELFDGRGHTLRARIEQLSKSRLTCSPVGPLLTTPRGPEVVLVQCVVKGKKMDDIVRMTTELGVSAVHLAVSEHCVVQKTERDEHKVERLTRVASEAARQSEQAYVPEIVEPASLEQVLLRAPDEAARVALTERSHQPFEVSPTASKLWVVVGPEGGLSARDRGLLANAKFAAVGLGRAILRTETAAVVGVALGFSALGRRR